MRGKPAIRAWLTRFVRTGLALSPEDILFAGPPWKMRIAIVFHDQARAEDGEIVYFNRGVLYIRTNWFRITTSESFEDTEKVAEFDDYLRSHRPDLFPARY